MPSTPSAIQNKYFELTVLILLILCFFPGFLQFVLLLPTRVVLPFFSRPIIVPETPPSAPVYVLSPDNMSSSWFQKTIHLPPQSRGSYLVTDAVVSQLPELKSYRVGLLNLFVQHTSCALSLNENWDSDVRADMSDALDRLVPMDRKGNLYRHSAEGEDDMPAHIKSALIGASVTVPISNGKVATGTWQGIWYLEFRTSKHSRKVVATIQGEKNS